MREVAQLFDDELGLLDLVQTIVENLRLLVLSPLAVAVFAWGVSYLMPPIYTAKTQFLPPQQQQSAAVNMLANLGSLGGLAGTVGVIKNPADQFLAYLKSATVQDKLIERFNLLDRYEVKTKTDARLLLSSNVRAAAGKDGLITIEVEDLDPTFSAELANAYVEELEKLLAKLATTEAQQRRMFFEKQSTLAKDKLVQSEIALRATGVSGNVLKSNPTAALAVVASLQAAVTAQEVKLGTLRGYLAETAPEFKQALNELANLRAQLVMQEKDGPTTNGKTSAEGDYVSKYRDFKYHETLFELFAKQFELAKIDESREGAVIQILDVAQTPERYSKPKRELIALISSLVAEFALLLFLTLRLTLISLGKNSEATKKLAVIKLSWRRAIGKS
jgi:capsule polysaccharide export protein KpsE/RkpR